MKKITDYAELIKAKHALNKTIAPVEDGASMTGSYTSGQQFIRDGVLYTALTSIAASTAWSSLTLDTDYEVADDVSTQIAAVNQTLTNNVSDINTALGNEVATRAKVSGHNLLPNNAVSQTINGVTFTKNADGSVTVNGTNSDANQFGVKLGKATLKAGTYKLSGCPSGQSYSTCWIYSYNATDGTNLVDDTGSGAEFTLNATKEIEISIFVAASATISNLTFYPMLRLATDANSDYEPYAMTNRELTPYVQVINNRNFLDNPFFTVNQRGGSSYNTTTASGYGLDRWWSIFANITVNDGSITLTRPSGVSYAANLRQAIIEEKALRGKKVTLSIDVEDFSGNCKIGIRKASGMNAGMTLIEQKDITNTGITTMTTTLPDDVESSTYPYLLATIETANTEGSYITIKAVKFEVGEISTLAIDEEPNYAEELLKCQRYFYKTKGNASYPTQTSYISEAGNNNYIMGFPFPVEMRVAPQVTNISAIDFFNVNPIIDSGISAGITQQGISYFRKDGAFETGLNYYMNFEASADL